MQGCGAVGSALLAQLLWHRTMGGSRTPARACDGLCGGLCIWGICSTDCSRLLRASVTPAACRGAGDERGSGWAPSVGGSPLGTCMMRACAAACRTVASVECLAGCSVGESVCSRPHRDWGSVALPAAACRESSVALLQNFHSSHHTFLSHEKCAACSSMRLKQLTERCRAGCGAEEQLGRHRLPSLLMHVLLAATDARASL